MGIEIFRIPAGFARQNVLPCRCPATRPRTDAGSTDGKGRPGPVIEEVSAGRAFPGMVSVVETTGPETIVIANSCGTRLSVVIKERSRLKLGEKVWLSADVSKLHFFEASEDGRRLAA
ncbi:TOBE domain-containing protein [Neorhizobium petrolearium]|uniref:TOBE domain-containing protein n=1 Tax=Neorhizobium petrolearium TaxID=515361 RepID=UPI003F5CBE66